MRRSRLVLILILASFFIFGTIEAYLNVRYQQKDALAFVHMLLLASLMFTWCKLDVRERNIEEPPGSSLLVAFIAVVGVPLYFFRTRPHKQAWISTLKSLGFVLVAFAVLLIGTFLGEYVAI